MSLRDIEKRLNRHRKPLSKSERSNNYLSGWLSKVLMGGIFVGLAVVIAGLAFIFYYVNEPRGVNLEVSAPADVSKGVPFELDANITNISGNPIKSASVTVSLDSGLLLWSPQSSDNSIFSENIGDVAVGNLSKRVYRIIPVGNLDSNQTIDVSLSYFSSNGSRFEIKKDVTVNISSSAVSLSVLSPDQILNGSLFSFSVNYANNSSFDLPDMRLEADLPSSFTLDSSSITPSSLAGVWDLGSLSSNSTDTISIKGEYANSNKTSFDVPLRLYAVLNGNNYEVADYTATFSLQPSPLGITVLVNGSDNYIAKPVDTLNYSIQYNNKSGIALKDVTVKAVLSGFIDWSTLKTDGILDPYTRTVTWNSSTTPSLQFMEPGATGNLSLSLVTSSNIPTSLQGLSTKNLYVKIDVSMKSPSVPYYLSGNQTFAETSEDTRVSSLVYLNTKVLFRDAASRIVNSGELPPKVGQPTEFTVHWLISNFGNDLSNAIISATLPPGVEFTGVSKSNISSSSPSFSSSTNSVVWNIGDIQANSGFITGPIEGIFQVQATPDVSEVGSYEPLLGQTTFQATDDFTGSTVTSSNDPATTLLSSDPSVTPGSGIVGQ